MPKAKDKEKLNNILNAALQLFSTKGFANTKMEDIAKKAGIATGTIYLYVKNKDEILEQMFNRFYNYYKNKLIESMDTLDNVHKKIDLLIKKDLEVVLESEERIRLFLIELRQSPFALTHMKRKILEHYQFFFNKIFDNAQVNVDLLSIVVGGIIENFAYYIWLSDEIPVNRVVSLHSKILEVIHKIITDISMV
jgi:TetR/AcrR family fatty acid metabolism transcriptional regulator